MNKRVKKLHRAQGVKRGLSLKAFVNLVIANKGELPAVDVLGVLKHKLWPLDVSDCEEWLKNKGTPPVHPQTNKFRATTTKGSRRPRNRRNVTG